MVSTSDKELIEKGKRTASHQLEEVTRSAPRGLKPGMADYMAGETKQFVGNLLPHLPQELIGGTIPHILGQEEESVWNAASQACGTEKVHFCYTVEDKKIYYLACPSLALASNPDSWCPLAAALPGNSEYWDKETVYLYEQEGIASALRWDPETGRMQVFLGASRTILPRVQSLDANFVTINADVADKVPWRNRNLVTEKLSRATARVMALTGMFVALGAVLFLLLDFILLNVSQRSLDDVQLKTQQASSELMVKAYNALQSDTIKHMVRIQQILDQLSKVDGTLVKYEVKGGKVEWEALVPPAFAADFGTPQGLEKDGRARVKNTK
ncbi:MAG: hypothetical protein LRY54_00995 [Alphaproteobacteria bacterium]|nr:hypothetical protein [Alphaproteobacteria bacterium]